MDSTRIGVLGLKLITRNRPARSEAAREVAQKFAASHVEVRAEQTNEFDWLLHAEFMLAAHLLVANALRTTELKVVRSVLKTAPLKHTKQTNLIAT
jgi:hypothetical protein